MQQDYLNAVWKDLPTIKLNDGAWNTEKGSEFLEKSKQMHKNLKVNLLIENNGKPTILKQLSKSHFNNLIKLSLEGNNIQSIQCFQRIRLTSVRLIYLGNNNIMNIQQMRKMQTPNLLVISLRKNEIKEFNYLQQAHFKQLQSLKVQWYGDKQTNADIKWITKLQSFKTCNIGHIQLYAMKRIKKQKYYRQVFQRKNRNLKLITFS